MPANTRVEKCFKKLKQSMPTGQAAATCQTSTGQSLATGRPLYGGGTKKKGGGGRRRGGGGR